MPAFLAAMVALATNTTAPLETQATSALATAQRSLRNGDAGRALATLDSLIFTNGVTVTIEKPGSYDESVAKGLDVWNQELGEDVFRLRPTGEKSDVVVKFVRSLDGEGQDVQGMVQAARELSWSSRDRAYRLRATIFVRDNAGGRRLRADEAVAVVAHEAGHLLGLADVQRDDRLMGPMTIGYPHSGPYPSEVQAVLDYRASIRESYPKWVDKR
jgi:hypothetical protein